MKYKEKHYTKTKLAEEFAIDRKDVLNIVKFFEGGGANA